MKKLINTPDTAIAERLEGFAEAHRDIVKLGPNRAFVQRASLKKGKVALVSGGGSGHEPLHAGFVGLGMLFLIPLLAAASSSSRIAIHARPSRDSAAAT